MNGVQSTCLKLAAVPVSRKRAGEEHYKKKISSMNLLVLHPNYNDFIHLKLPEMKKEAEFLINQAKELTN